VYGRNHKQPGDDSEYWIGGISGLLRVLSISPAGRQPRKPSTALAGPAKTSWGLPSVLVCEILSGRHSILIAGRGISQAAKHALPPTDAEEPDTRRSSRPLLFSRPWRAADAIATRPVFNRVIASSRTSLDRCMNTIRGLLALMMLAVMAGCSTVPEANAPPVELAIAQS